MPQFDTASVSSVNIEKPSAKGLTRLQQKQRTRRNIINAAAILFEEEGYALTTVTKILRAAKVSRPTFYAHFSSKAEVANAVAEDLFPRLGALFKKLDGIDQPNERQLYNWLIKFKAFWGTDKRITESATVANTTDPELTLYYSSILPDTMENLMPKYLSRFEGEARKKALTKLMLFMIQLERLMFLVELRGFSFPDEDPLNPFAQMWWQALYGVVEK